MKELWDKILEQAPEPRVWQAAVARYLAPPIDKKGNKDQSLIDRIALSLSVAYQQGKDTGIMGGC
jgi:hypothetical protein